MDDPEKYLEFIPTKIGRWWNNSEEIDLVAFDDTHIAFIECKWQNQKPGYDTFKDLQRKAELVPQDSGQQKVYVLFSKHGVKKSLQEADCRCNPYL